MTPARKAALQWFYDRGETRLSRHNADQPSGQMILAMIRAKANLNGVWLVRLSTRSPTRGGVICMGPDTLDL
jgi:hypothetical protein